ATACAHNSCGMRPRGGRRLCRHCAKWWVKWVSASSAWAEDTCCIPASPGEANSGGTIRVGTRRCHAGLPERCHREERVDEMARSERTVSPSVVDMLLLKGPAGRDVKRACRKGTQEEERRLFTAYTLPIKLPYHCDKFKL